MKIVTRLKTVFFIALLITAISAKPIGQAVPITFLEKFIEIKGQLYSLQEQGKYIKAQKTWDAADALVKKQFKDGSWYALPEKCLAKKGNVYSMQRSLHVECFDSLPVGENNSDGIQFAFQIIDGKNHDRLLEMIQDTGDDFLELSFRVGRSSVVGGSKYTAYAHTGLLGFTVYVTDIKIHARRKDPNVTEESKSVAADDQTVKERIKVWFDHIYPMLSTLELHPVKLPKPKSCFAPNERVSKGAFADIQKVVQEKQLNLDLSDITGYGSHQLCKGANQDNTSEACLDACTDRVLDYWK